MAEEDHRSGWFAYVEGDDRTAAAQTAQKAGCTIEEDTDPENKCYLIRVPQEWLDRLLSGEEIDEQGIGIALP